MKKKEKKYMDTVMSFEDKADLSVNVNNDSNQIICACANLKLSDFEKTLGRMKTQSFSALLSETSAGSTCTACLLDLEYFFVEAKSRNPKHFNSDDKTNNLKQLGVIPTKQHIYKILDSITPPIAWAPTNFIPIIKGDNIETWLTITNHDLLFRERKSAPITSSIEIRATDGSFLFKDKIKIDLGEELKLRLDTYLKFESQPLVVGAAYINTYAKFPAMRGTIRPQFEILAEAGACALHAQGDVGPGDTWFTIQNKPLDQRIFLILVNTFHKPQSAKISWPFELYNSSIKTKNVESLQISSRGTEIFEINCGDALTARLEDRPFSVKISTERSCRVYLLCGTPQLDRFSIDHR